jgi:hypothetical protein
MIKQPIDRFAPLRDKRQWDEIRREPDYWQKFWEMRWPEESMQLEDEEPKIILPMDHPYVANFNADVRPWPNGVWRVVWRSFDSQKQDHLVNSEKQAQELAAELKANCHIVDDEYTIGAFAECERFWLDLYKEKKNG